MPKKRFGQHFLQDTNVIDQFLKQLNPRPTDHFVEIGPGQGALTQALLKTTIARLDAIEIEREALAALKQRCGTIQTLHIHEADATQFDFRTLQKAQKPIRLIGNLPYNISSPLLFHCLSFIDLFQDIHFMLQKEVVDRIVALPGSKIYGRLSLTVQYYCQAERLFDVPPEAFWPIPRVMSSVFKLTPHPYLSTNDPAETDSHQLFEKIVQRAFSQRRKMLSNSLAHFISADELRQLGIDPKQRPEQLPKETFIKLGRYLNNKESTC